MKTKFKQLLIAMTVLAVLVMLPAAVQADPITLTLDITHTVAQGGSVTYNGTLSNGGTPARFINNVSLTFGGPASVTFDVSAFFSTVPAELNPGQTVTGAFFTAMAGILTTPGTYIGSFSVLGGDNDTEENLLATQEFTLIVVPGGQDPIPEPATMLLLGSGLAGAAALRRRKRRQAETS